MITNEEIIEKILRMGQLSSVIEQANKQEIKDVLKEIQIWHETVFERYYQESKHNYANAVAILQQRSKIAEQEKEMQKLKKQLEF